ncbi:MAG: pyroglutamyl-peptidase I [Clostridiales bacterium 38-18]|nr:MAG: pyroglutamyl-peptidase I [Clostridiales bacterium 38-18]
MKVLITGFEPFGGERINPSYEAVKSIKAFENIEVIKACLPVVFGDSITMLEQLIDLHKPDIVICVGQAGGRQGLTIERVGINIDDARIPDNNGNQPIDERIVDNAPDGLFSNLPIKAIVDQWTLQDVNGSVSNTAGTYVCNHLLFGLLEMRQRKTPLYKGGFIHVPYIPEQNIEPSMSLEMITKGLEIAIETSVGVQVDIKQSQGTIC